MPLSYAGTASEHCAVRQGVGLFDLCHMGRLQMTGADALGWLQRVMPTNLAALAVGHARYGVVLTESGGIVDDIIVTRTDRDCYDLCVNAANRQTVLDHLYAYREGCSATLVDVTANLAQIAVQGPLCGPLLDSLLDAPGPAFMATAAGHFKGQSLTISRTGYSGELGVELFCPTSMAVPLWQHLLDAGATPCGLGARDTLRLEVGYPLYGHELSLQSGPVAAGLAWSIDWQRDDWLGYGAVCAERDHPTQVLHGLMLDGPGIPRQGCTVLAGDQPVGVVTSGNMGLSVGKGIALAYLSAYVTGDAAPLAIEVRGRKLPAHLVRPPFYKDGTVKAALN